MGRTSFSLGLKLLLALVPACGGTDVPTLTISHTYESDGFEEQQQQAITSVLMRACITRYLGEDEPAFDEVDDLPPEGEVTIAHGEEHVFELTPGCLDVIVLRDTLDETRWGEARARVVLATGESAVWVPWLATENESWWCEEDACP